MYTPTLLATLLVISSVRSIPTNPTYPLPVAVVHDFPNGTWIENLAVRSNGQILATQDGAPKIYQVDPFAKVNNSVLLHEFNDTASVLGIIEGVPDVFYVATAIFSSKTGETFGEDYIYRLDFNVDPLQIDRIATAPTSGALDGLAYLGGENDLLLATDAFLGVIWSISIETGECAIAINSTYTCATQGFAANGAKVRGADLYSTNTAQQNLVKVPVDSRGAAAGPYTVLAEGPGFEPDDFALDIAGDSYVASYTNGSNGIVFIPR